ncbi:MAG: peptide ABC transporter substrate-binding protein, partial [Gammaproteobacteria bacterium]
MRGWFLLWFLLVCLSVSAATAEAAWNNPYPPQESTQNIFYSSFGERPNHLDPARSYSSNEITFTGQIYEPPLQYHYLKRPYELIPLAAESMPQTIYLDAQNQPLGDHPAPESIAYTLYRISIRPGILYQPHPAFARDVFGSPSYLDMGRKSLRGINKLSDFRETGTRELVASDYVYEIKRLAHPALQSPIFGLMSEYIVGLADYAKTLQTAWDALKKKKGENAFL